MSSTSLISLAINYSKQVVSVEKNKMIRFICLNKVFPTCIFDFYFFANFLLILLLQNANKHNTSFFITNYYVYSNKRKVFVFLMKNNDVWWDSIYNNSRPNQRLWIR